LNKPSIYRWDWTSSGKVTELPAFIPRISRFLVTKSEMALIVFFIEYQEPKISFGSCYYGLDDRKTRRGKGIPSQRCHLYSFLLLSCLKSAHSMIPLLSIFNTIGCQYFVNDQRVCVPAGFYLTVSSVSIVSVELPAYGPGIATGDSKDKYRHLATSLVWRGCLFRQQLG
jgi:hypothetical protein